MRRFSSALTPARPLTRSRARSPRRLLAPLIAGMTFATSAGAADLLEVYRLAMAYDPIFAGARALALANEERAVQGRAALLPALGLNGSHSRGSQETERSDFDFRSNTYSLSLSQPLFRPAAWAAYQQGKLSSAIGEVQFAQARQELILRVAQAYFDVLAAQDALTFIEAQQAAITEQLASAKRNFEVGTATITDTNEAQARFDLARAQAIAARNDMEVRQAALYQLIGRLPDPLAPLRPGVKLPLPTPMEAARWVDSAEQYNFSVLVQQLTLDIARQEIKRSRAGHYPSVDLVASRSRSDRDSPVSLDSGNGTTASTGFGGRTDSSSIGVQWTIPLFSGFAVNSRVRETIALEDQARFNLDNARRSAAQGARQSFLSVNSGLAQVRALEAAETSSQSALESNRLGYEVGVRINIDVLNAQQQLFSTRRDLARARYDTILNGLRLEAAAGTLTEEDLVAINTLLSDGAQRREDTGAARRP